MSVKLAWGVFSLSLGLSISVSSVFAAEQKEMQVVFRLRERVAMTRLADAVSDPRSPRYRRFYTPDEIRQIAGPTDRDYVAFLQQVENRGFQLVSESKTHLFITVTGPQELFESVFATHIHPVDATSGRHRTGETPTVPTELSLIFSVIGLDTSRASTPIYKLGLKAATFGNDPTGLEPDQIKGAYGFKPIYQSGITGKGQHIAIATYDQFDIREVQSYYSQQHIRPAPAVDAVEFNGHAQGNADSAMETDLDAEFSGMIAPGAQIHVFTSARNDDPGEVQLFTSILDDNRAKVANYSWGDCEANITAQHFQDMNAVFARAVAQGVNITAASGDWGSYGCPGRKPGKVNADWPAANPYVLAIGGTSVTSAYENAVKEQAWNSTGGGISAVWDLPAWQKGLGAPYVKRSFPDVAFNADPNSGEPAYIKYNGMPTWMQIGGTSISAPQWAGFLTLVGEARAGLPGLGYLNPIIYSMSDADRAKGFHDIVKGSNGAYSAAKGWDPTTGWGSMQAVALLELLRKH